MLQGLAADIPVAGVEGRLFVATDTLILYRDNGSAWAMIGGGGGSQNLDSVLLIGNVSSQGILLQDGGNNLFLSGLNGLSTIIEGVGSTVSNTGFSTDGGFFNVNKDNTDSLQAGGGTIKLQSGTYTPIISNKIGVGLTTVLAANYQIIDKITTINMSINIQNSGVNQICSLEFTLPINIANVGGNLIGNIISTNNGNNVVDTGGVGAGGTFGRARIDYLGKIASNFNYFVTVSYTNIN
jgi:hypothetical protein